MSESFKELEMTELQQLHKKIEFLPVQKQPKVTGTQFLYNEFFHSIQGEGKFIGKRVVFFRTPLCPLRCEFCDSAAAVSGIDSQVIDFEELGSYLVEETQVQQVVWTGGEPLLFFHKILDFYEFLKSKYQSCQIPQFAFETNGTIFWEDMKESNNFFFTVSPKLGVSGQASKLNIQALKDFNSYTNCQFKFVVQQKQELDEIYELLEQVTINPKEQVVFQPEWYQFESLESVKETGDYWKPYWLFMKDLAEHLLADKRWNEYDWSVLPQMHKMFWGNIAGV